MAEAFPWQNLPPADVFLAGDDVLAEREWFRQPDTHAGWNELGVRCMAALAEIGELLWDNQVIKDPYRDYYGTVSIPNYHTARVDYHENLGEDEMGLGEEVHQIVKVQPHPRLTPGPRDSFMKLVAARNRYERDRANPPEYSWQSNTAHKIMVLRTAQNELLEVGSLPDEELEAAVLSIRGVTVMAAMHAKNYQLAERLHNLWDPEKA